MGMLCKIGSCDMCPIRLDLCLNTPINIWFFFCVAVKVSKCHSGHLRQTLIMLALEDDGDNVGVDDSDAPRSRMTDLFWLWGETSIQSTLK